MTYKRKDLPQIREIDIHKSLFPYKKFKVAPRKLVPSQTERVPALLKKAKAKFPNPNPDQIVFLDKTGSTPSYEHKLLN